MMQVNPLGPVPVKALDEAGHGQVVTIVGEAGVEKSRLVYEVIHSNGWPVPSVYYTGENVHTERV